MYSAKAEKCLSEAKKTLKGIYKFYPGSFFGNIASNKS